MNLDTVSQPEIKIMVIMNNQYILSMHFMNIFLFIDHYTEMA